MAFKSTTTTAATPSASMGAPGGRYAGIRPAMPTTDLLKAGEYVLELVTGKGSRKGTTAIIKCKVLEAAGDGATQPGPDVRQFMINFGGKAFDTGIARLVSLCMAICNCETLEQLAAEEPHYDELIDLLCGKRENSEYYGGDPAAGRKIWAKGWNSAALSSRGEPFVNWEFGMVE
jgi:hypothetical protein